MATTARKTNWFAIWVSIAVVAVLAVVTVLVVVMNNQPKDTGATPTSSHITSSGAIVFGESKTNTVTTYVDFLCPICNEFEQSEGATIKTAVDGGKTTLEVVPVAILDSRSNPAGYSSRAGSAIYSVVIHD